MLTISDGLQGQARQRPDQVALVCGEESVSYAELDRRVNAAAHVLWAQGVRPGDRVATLLPNGLVAAELLFAAARCGAVVCPLNPRSAPAELAYLLGDARPRVLVALPPLLDAARPVLPPDIVTIPDLPAGVPGEGYRQRCAAAPSEPFPSQAAADAPWLLVYTSGTTGRPKGALRTQFSDYLMGLMLAPAVGIGPGDVGMAWMPLFHVNSIWVVTLSVCVGTTCHIHAPLRFQPGALIADLDRSGATYSMFVPSILGYLADALERGEARCPNLRVLMTSSAPLPPSLRDRLLAALPSANLVEIYGATELGAVTLEYHRAGQAGGTIGFPLPGVRVRLLGPDRKPVAPTEPGELFVESPQAMIGYFGRTAETEAVRAGEYTGVGDLAVADEAGRLRLVDRVADTIITGGENVYPTEVESVLMAHPAVFLAAVIGVPDERRGEAVTAAVVVRPGQTVAPAQLSAHCRAHLAAYKCPRTIVVTEELPLSMTGKVLRRRVRELWAEGALPAAEAAPSST